MKWNLKWWHVFSLSTLWRTRSPSLSPQGEPKLIRNSFQRGATVCAVLAWTLPCVVVSSHHSLRSPHASDSFQPRCGSGSPSKAESMVATHLEDKGSGLWHPTPSVLVHGMGDMATSHLALEGWNYSEPQAYHAGRKPLMGSGHCRERPMRALASTAWSQGCPPGPGTTELPACDSSSEESWAQDSNPGELWRCLSLWTS